MSEKVCTKLAFCVDSVFSEGKGYGAIPCQDAKRREKCIVFLDTRSKPCCAEKGKSFTIQNTRNLLVLGIKLDGGVFIDADFRKCDYMFVFQEKQKQKLEDKEVVPDVPAFLLFGLLGAFGFFAVFFFLVPFGFFRVFACSLFFRFSGIVTKTVGEQFSYVDPRAFRHGDADHGIFGADTENPFFRLADDLARYIFILAAV